MIDDIRAVLVTVEGCLRVLVDERTRLRVGAKIVEYAQSLAAGVAYRHCSECSALFEVSPGLNRSHKIYCGNACRMKAMRTRKKREKTK